MDDDDSFFEVNGQVFPSDSAVEEEEEINEPNELNKNEKLQPKYDIEQISSFQEVKSIDFTKFIELSKQKQFPSNVLDLIDQYLEQFLNFVDDNIAVSSDSLEMFHNNLIHCCQKAETSSTLTNDIEKTCFEFEFKLRLATFYLISFIDSNNPIDSENFLQILNQFDDFNEQNDIFSFSLQKRYYILFSTYLILIKFDSFDNIANSISWVSFDDDYSFEDELFAPYACIADGIKNFSHRLYKQAALRSSTAFNLFSVKNVGMRKKCLVVYYFSALLLTSEIKIIPESNQKNFENFFLDKSIESNHNKEDRPNDSSPKSINHENNNKIYFDDENIKLIFQFINYHKKRDYKSAVSNSKEFCQKVGQSYSFVLNIQNNNLSLAIKKRAIIHFLIPFRVIQVDFLFQKFSFSSVEETKNVIIEMINQKEINHFLNDSTNTLELDKYKSHKDNAKRYDPFNQLKDTNELLNSFIKSLL